MKLATWNVNSIRQREKHVAGWLERCRPDVLVLQEIKCEAHAFPALTFQGLGYQSEAVGQKAYNGVAVLSRLPFTVTHRSLPGLPADDAQSRYLEIQVDGMTVIGIYLPNGNSGGEDGFAYKLRLMDRLGAWVRERLDAFEPCAVLGDFNVCPTEADLAPGALPPTDALVHPESRARFRALLHAGMTDALAALHPGDAPFTYWDYGPAFESNRGLRIDHILLSPELAERLVECGVDVAARAEDAPSDHAPVWCDIR